jgi:hypothetical protein
MLCIVAASLAVTVAAAARFGLDDNSWLLVIPVLASIAAAVLPTRLVVGMAMLVTAATLVLELDDSGPLFGATLVSLILALNHLQGAATQIRRRRPVPAPHQQPT